MLGIWPHLCCSSFVAGTMSKKTRAMSIISSVKELKEWGIGSKANYFEFLHMKIMISPDDCSVGRRWISAMAIIQRCGSSGSMCVCVCTTLLPQFPSCQRIKYYPWQWKWPGLKLSPQIEKSPTTAPGPGQLWLEEVKCKWLFCTLINRMIP